MIELQNIEIRYGDFVAVRDVNFKVEQGEFFTLLGPSGCGKTTTLRAIAGFNTPSQGRILYNGNDITNVPVEKRDLGMVFQSYALFPTMSVYDNIAYGLKVEKRSKDFIEQRVHELAGLVEIKEDQLHKNVSALSGGQQQRVAIARALARDYNVILFDEPLSNLDAKLRKQLRVELKNIQERTGLTAIYVTHDQEEALELSDQIAVFNNGYIEQIGTPKEIFDRPATEFICTFVGETNFLPANFIEVINQQLDAQRYDPTKKHYIRHEKIKLPGSHRNPGLIALDGLLEHEVFQGTFLRYQINVYGTRLQVIKKNDGHVDFQAGQAVTVYLDPADILEY